MIEKHLRDLLEKEKNKTIFLEKENQRLRFIIANTRASDNITVVNPIFLNPIVK